MQKSKDELKACFEMLIFLNELNYSAFVMYGKCSKISNTVAFQKGDDKQRRAADPAEEAV